MSFGAQTGEMGPELPGMSSFTRSATTGGNFGQQLDNGDYFGAIGTGLKGFNDFRQNPMGFTLGSMNPPDSSQQMAASIMGNAPDMSKPRQTSGGGGTLVALMKLLAGA